MYLCGPTIQQRRDLDFDSSNDRTHLPVGTRWQNMRNGVHQDDDKTISVNHK